MTAAAIAMTFLLGVLFGIPVGFLLDFTRP
jgi:hypothetical protein